MTAMTDNRREPDPPGRTTSGLGAHSTWPTGRAGGRPGRAGANRTGCVGGVRRSSPGRTGAVGPYRGGLPAGLHPVPGVRREGWGDRPGPGGAAAVAEISGAAADAGACRGVDRPEGRGAAGGVPVPGPPGARARRPGCRARGPSWPQAPPRRPQAAPGRPAARRTRAGRPGRPARPGDPGAAVRDRHPGRGAVRPPPRRRRPGGRHRPGARQGGQGAGRAVRGAGPRRRPRLPRRRPRRHAPRPGPTGALGDRRPAATAPTIERRCSSIGGGSR